jgi:mono/diheme cytochrome c family protein
VLHGQRAMPPFGESLSDEQIAAVLNYVRTHFGNRYRDAITPATVGARRAALTQEAGGVRATPIDPRAGSH